MLSYKVLLSLLILIYKVNMCGCMDWKKVKCATDGEENIPEGTTPLSRFPWLGVVQYTFYMAQRMRYAVTSGVLVHPGYLLAPAQDISRIPLQTIGNTTVFIVWGAAGEKYVLNVFDYVLHPDFVNKVTLATVALMKLARWTFGNNLAPVAPICLPLKGMNTFDNLYIAKMSDNDNIIHKQIHKAFYVVNKECTEFYYRAQMTYAKMAPRHTICASAATENATCIWDGGTVLVTRMNNLYWTLIGFGMRGPGCGAPARFAEVLPLMKWVDYVVSNNPLLDVPPGQVAFFLRQTSPYSLQMFKADQALPTEYGQCDRDSRGSVIYKDQNEILANRNIAQGFYFLSVHHLASFKCATVKFVSMARSRLSVWVEHDCHKDVTGLAPGMQGPDIRKMECFMYFRSVAFVEFRFTFSFKAEVVLVMYGQTGYRGMQLPFVTGDVPTDAWYPTYERIRLGVWYPCYVSYWT